MRVSKVWAGIAGVALLAGCSGAQAAAPEVTVTATKTVQTPGPTVTQTLRPIATITVAAKPPAAAVAIGEGVWVIGEDIAPGRYRMIANSNGDCYWGIYRANTNQDDIINNGSVSGGRATVVLKAGQEFESSRCGGWKKAD